MPPIVILCLQLIIGTVCDASPYIRPALAGPVALFPSAGASSPSLHRSSSSNISTSKRQPTTLIESGDGFAYRQHHQPPGQQKHHQPPDEGHFYGQQHPHFRQPQAFPPDHHVYQPGPLSPFNRGGSGSENFMSEVPSEPQDYYQQRSDGYELAFPEVTPSPSSSAEMENEIVGSPLLFADDSKYPPPSGAGSNSNSNSGGESFDLIRESLERIKEEEDIDIKSELLMRLLEQMPEGPLPVVYIEDSAGKGAESGDGSASDDDGVVEGDDQLTGNGSKRSGRYYRRYPWKRQNSRSRTYDADARYLCVPSREDIFKLLVGLHENRTGNHQRTINFCNRKRPAKAIFTNIRFLG
ncbi:uncharacterized protein LOC5573899 [Aedes aegypti]|uniref:Uncharacterized protein n=1 Tax=Aedes aegypti TaxID=7159 RepID=A0A6I8U8C4_AEDAE|nr:uncharacterized protein LOC5573899 [Aedes aegypti]